MFVYPGRHLKRRLICAFFEASAPMLWECPLCLRRSLPGMEGPASLAFSGISNKANLDGNTETTHEEVLAAGSVIAPKLLSIIRGVLESLSV